MCLFSTTLMPPILQNYHPISLLPIISRVLKCHIYAIILEHLQTYHPLCIHQCGFLERRSMVSALLYCTNEWFKALEDGKEVCAVFFDLQKAFDSVPHAPLLNKLQSIYYQYAGLCCSAGSNFTHSSLLKCKSLDI